MLGVTHFLSRHAINFLISFTLLTVLTVSFDSFLLGLILFFGGYFVTNKVTLAMQKRKKTRSLGLNKAEYRQIEEQLKLAKESVFKLTQNYVRIRSIKSFKTLNEMSRLSKRIINIVHTNPQKFYVVEDFFYAHLPSAVQLSEKYALLTREQVKSTEIHLALENARTTLKELQVTMEEDLKMALQSDLEHLKIELDFAKMENEKRRNRLGGGDIE